MNDLSVKILGFFYRALRGGAPITTADTAPRGSATYHQLEAEEGAVTQTIRSVLARLHAEAAIETRRNCEERDSMAYTAAIGGIEFVGVLVRPEDIPEGSPMPHRVSEVINARRFRVHQVKSAGEQSPITMRTTTFDANIGKETDAAIAKRNSLALTQVEWGQLTAFVQTVCLESEVLRLVESGKVSIPFRDAVLQQVSKACPDTVIADAATDMDLRLGGALWAYHHGRSCARCYLAVGPALATFLYYTKTHGLPGWRQMLLKNDLGSSFKEIKQHAPASSGKVMPVCTWCRRSTDLLVRVSLLGGEYPIIEQFCPYEAALLRRAHIVALTTPYRTPAGVERIEELIREKKYPLPLDARRAIPGLADIVAQEIGMRQASRPTCPYCQKADGLYMYIIKNKEGLVEQSLCPNHAFDFAKREGEAMSREEFLELIAEGKLTGMVEGKPVELFDGRWKPSIVESVAHEPEVAPIPKPEAPKAKATTIKPNDDKCPRCVSLCRKAKDAYRMHCEKEGDDFFGRWLCATCMNEIYPQVCARDGCDRHCWKQSYNVAGVELCGLCHNGLLDAGFSDETGVFDAMAVIVDVRLWVRDFAIDHHINVIGRKATPAAATASDFAMRINGERVDAKITKPAPGADKKEGETSRKTKTASTAAEQKSDEPVDNRGFYFCVCGCDRLMPLAGLSIVKVKRGGKVYKGLYHKDCAWPPTEDIVGEPIAVASTREGMLCARKIHDVYGLSRDRNGGKGIFWSEEFVVADETQPAPASVPVPIGKPHLRGPNGEKLTKAQKKAAEKRMAKGLPPAEEQKATVEPEPSQPVELKSEDEVIATPSEGNGPIEPAPTEEIAPEPVITTSVAATGLGNDDSRLKGLTGNARARVLKRLQLERNKGAS